jgi:HK97 family phage major capsid protein
MMITDFAKAKIEDARVAQKAAQDILDAHKKDGAWDSAESAASYDAAIEDALSKKAVADEAVTDAKRQSKAQELEDWLGTSAGKLPGMASGGTVGSKATDDNDNDGPSIRYKANDGAYKVHTPAGGAAVFADWTGRDEATYTALQRRYIAEGGADFSSDDRALIRRKALSVGSDVAGGFLVLSEVMLSQIIEALEDAVVMRRLANVLPPLTAGAALTVPTASDLTDAEWTTEIGTGTQDTAEPFGQRQLRPHPLAKAVKVSNTLLRMSAVDVEAWLRGEIANRFAEAEESAFMTGTGFNRPEGVFVSGLPTDVTAASATDLAYDDVSSTVYGLKPQYGPGASWIIHRTIVKEMSQIKDGNDLPIFGLIAPAGRPNDLLGFPVNMTEYAPSSSATGLYVAALGNWKRAYWIVDSLNFGIQRVNELYAATNQTGFFARKETDGMLVDGSGVVRLKMA